MLQRFRDRFGPAGLVVAIGALVLALAGGAYAASGALTGKQKKEVEKIAKKYANSNPGAPGAPGTNGTNGTNGAPGEKGEKGDTGEDGKSVETGNATTGECPSGGATVQVAGEVATKKKVCNGTFSTEPLPSGESLTGVWGTSAGEGKGLAMAAVSFPIEVSPAPTTLVQAGAGIPAGVQIEDGASHLYPSNPPGSTFPEIEEAWENACPGSASAPTATAGFLCLYASSGVAGSETPPSHASLHSASSSGVVVPFTFPIANSFAEGTWAVTAP